MGTVKSHLRIRQRERAEPGGAGKRKQMDSAFHDQLSAFHSISDAAFAGVCIHEKGIILESNERFAEMVGYSTAELRGMSLLDITPPENRSFAIRKLKTLPDGPYAVIIQRKNGTRFLAEVAGRTIRYHSKEARVGLIRSLREIPHANGVLQLQDYSYERVLEWISLPCWIFDADTLGFVAVNKAALTYHGYTRNDFHSMSLLDLGPAGRMESLLSYLSQIRSGMKSPGGWFQARVTQKQSNGRTAPVLLLGIRLVHHGKNCVLSIVIDRSRFKKSKFSIELLKTSSEFLAAADEKGELVFWCKPGELLYDADVKRGLGNFLHSILTAHPQHPAIAEGFLTLHRQGHWETQVLEQQDDRLVPRGVFAFVIPDTKKITGYLGALVANKTTAPQSALAQTYRMLTARQKEVINLVLEGKTSAEIAARIGISRRTVESYRTAAMKRLGVRNQAQLIRSLLKEGL